MSFLSRIKQARQEKFYKKVNEIIEKSGLYSYISQIPGSTWRSISGNDSQRECAGTYTKELYIYGCVYLISNTIASLPLKIYQDAKDSNGNISRKDITSTHPASALFTKPNMRDSFYDIKEQACANMCLTGNSYMLLDGTKNDKDTPNAIFILRSSEVEVVQNKSGDIKTIADLIQTYKYMSKTEYPPYSVLHERTFNPLDDINGLSPIKAGAVTIDSVIEAKQRNHNIFKNGVSSDGAFETDQAFSENVYKRLQADMVQKYTGNTRSHMPMVLFNGLKYKDYGINQKDLEYINGLKLSREELCGFLFQVPLILLGVLENSSYNNIKEATKIFYNMSIIPRLVKQQELFQKLIDRYNIAGAYCEFDLSDVEALKESLSDKIKNAQTMWSMGTPLNDAYQFVGIDLKVDGGDVGYLPFSLSPVSSATSDENNEPVEPLEPGKSIRKAKVIKWTAELKALKWKDFDQRTRKIESKYRGKLASFFNEQQAEVERNLNKYKSIKAMDINSHARVFMGEKIDSHELKAININSVLFDKDDEIKRLRQVSVPIYTEAMKSQGQAELDLLDLGINFDVTNPKVVSFIKAYSLEKATLVNETIIKSLRAQLIEGVNAGESIPDLQKRIKDVYAGYDLKGFETERIARTEVIGASNQGALESYNQSGVVKKKGWLATQDDRTRDTHLEAEKQYENGIPIDSDFIIAGDAMQAPGGGSDPGENINCRCSIIPIVEE